MKKIKFTIKYYCCNCYISLYVNETNKKLNCYIAFAKHCLVIKLGEFNSDQ